MKYIILCCGIGKRCNNYSLPKPLNYINGRHMIEYVIENIPSDEIYIIYTNFLDEYNFREIIINKFKKKIFNFSIVDYLTRGPVESSFIGLKNFDLGDDNIVFLDNDIFNKFPKLNHISNHFIGYSIDYKKNNYSFIKINNNQVVEIKEKTKISDYFCCGIYGFKNVNSFNFYADQIIKSNNKTKNEFYFSQVYKLMISLNETVEPIYMENVRHLGSYNEISNQTDLVDRKKLRICFDLDNTLVTNPTVPGDYSTVKPIIKNIDLLKKLHNEGHEIIIYTARRMETHKHNIGKVVKDIALVTLNKLEELDIPYNEIIFGKPIADIYIDDKAINPFINDLSYFGIFYPKEEFIPNKIKNNCYNKIEKKENRITKIGPTTYMKGELYYYNNIPNHFSIFFPKLIEYIENIETIELTMDYISGIPLYYLYKNKLFTEKHIDDLFIILNNFHSYKEVKINITDENLRNNYIKKLQNRFNKFDYPFADAQELLQIIINDINENWNPLLVNMIHGDFWFSNIFLTYDDEYKLIDMKGQVDGILTINGDVYYDFGKLYQSVLGYDLILNDDQLDIEYIKKIKIYFLNKCQKIGMDVKYLKAITNGLIFGTFTFIKNRDETKKKIWNLLKSNLMNEL